MKELGDLGDRPDEFEAETVAVTRPQDAGPMRAQPMSNSLAVQDASTGVWKERGTGTALLNANTIKAIYEKCTKDYDIYSKDGGYYGRGAGRFGREVELTTEEKLEVRRLMDLTAQAIERYKRTDPNFKEMVRLLDELNTKGLMVFEPVVASPDAKAVLKGKKENGAPSIVVPPYIKVAERALSALEFLTRTPEGGEGISARPWGEAVRNAYVFVRDTYLNA